MRQFLIGRCNCSPVDCSKCSKPAVTFIRYSGNHLCEDHFLEFFDKRVKKEMRKQCEFKADTKVAVALSGGKDSSVAALVLDEIISKRRDMELHAITVDEGIEGYRPESLKMAREFCESRDIPHHVVTFKELVAWTMDEIARADERTIPCTYCGVFRRKALNSKAREIGANYLATGLNLDDTAQSVLMNFARGDIEKLARMGPHTKAQKDLIPRIQPLRTIPEKEVYLFSMLKGIEIHNAECPYAERAFRGRFRDMLYALEKSSPGTKHGILSTYDSIQPALQTMYPPANLKGCKNCGEPTLSDLCKSCVLIERLKASS
ncbi:MAG: TIGR00269 family protein [Thermoplasmata archaeon]|nr:TIGR00269 family protein [Thermoplasmata archaeon]